MGWDWIPEGLNNKSTYGAKKTVKKGDIVHTWGGGQPQFPFFAQIYRNLSGPQITQKLTQTPWKYNFLSHFFAI